LLILKCVSDQEKIESSAATIKRVDCVNALQLFNTERAHLDAAAVEDTRLLEKLGEPWGRARRRVQSLLESLPLAGSQPETPAIRQCLLGTSESALKNKFANRPVSGESGGLQRLEPGDALDMEIAGEEITLRPVRGTGPLAKEHGVWVFRVGLPLPASATDTMLQQIRAERDQANLASSE
jgi:hypothetical protein